MSEICALAFLISRYCIEQLYESRLELNTLKQLRQLREQQFAAVSQSQASINQKCHDLKHYIFYLRKQKEEDKNRILDEMEEAVNAFDRKVQTGNPELDTILTEEIKLFRQNQIELHCIADGALLQFMQAVDLYVLLGNILDNCRECVLNEQAPGRRLVSLNILRKQDMVMIRTENYSERKPVLLDGFPLTSKDDAGNHGLGLRSVRSIAESYGGFLTVSYEGGIFTLRILLPLQMPSYKTIQTGTSRPAIQ